VTGTSFPSGELRPSNKSVKITFSTPLAKYTDAELAGLITTQADSSSGQYSYVDNTSVSIYNNNGFKPGQTYIITFSANLKDRGGRPLDRTIISPSQNRMHRPVWIMAFRPCCFTRPEDPTISVQAVNIHTLEVGMSSMTLDEFLLTQSDYSYSRDYVPADLQTWTKDINLPLNDNQPVVVSLSNSPLAPGLYYASIDSPDVKYHGFTARFLVVSNVNLTLKVSATEALVWAVDLRTQAPVQNMPVTLYAGDAVLTSGITDENGLWRGQFPEAGGKQNGYYAVLGQPGDDLFAIATSRWSSGIMSWDFNLSFNGEGPVPDVYLYTERPSTGREIPSIFAVSCASNMMGATRIQG